jgi:hypothetical protein
VLRVNGAHDVGEGLLLGRREVVGRTKALGAAFEQPEV